MFNKRQYTRFDFDKKINLKKDDIFVSGIVDNLSLKGASIIIDLKDSQANVFKEADNFKFEMHFIDDEDIAIEGDATIVCLEENRLNIRFNSVSKDYFKKLIRLLELSSNNSN